ncbi:MAG: OmpH family outer membrane protein [Candidatus Margulisbacteria bacterium]|nr:OmpH family outer membrane protein [Candidatus Margulisiibacteriota bacterium]
MRKLLVFGLIVFSWGFSATAIGYVDTLEVLQSYNKAIAAQADLVQKQQDVQEFFALKQKEYESYVQPDSTEQEIFQIKKELENAVEPKRQELLELNKKLSNEIEEDILVATETISKQLKLDIVLDKKSVLVGGMDITTLVVDKLNNKNK